MTGLRMTNRSIFGRRGRKSRGFTLVELIVVLTIIAILAAVGVATALGFINRSKFDQNSQNAITVYQTAQVALSQKMSDGSIDSWTRGIESFKPTTIFEATDIEQLESSKTTDQSIHKKVALTYNPKSADNTEDKYLYDLLSGYFYDMTVFGSTISLELDVSATYGSGKVNYSARVLSAFSSSQNTAVSGWDSNCIGAGYSSEFPELPQARGDEGYNYRRSKSFVGWFNGTAESVTVPSGLSPVFLPQSAIVPLDGHLVAGDETGYLFNLRNGETLDVAWAIFDEAGECTLDHNENLIITLKSAGDGNQADERLYGNDPSDSYFYDDVQIKINAGNLDAFLDSVATANPSVKYENISVYDITRTTREGFIKADVVRKEYGIRVTYSSIVFPLSVTKVEGDGRQGTPRDENGDIAPYYEFRLSIDAMMERSDENANNRWNHFSIDRLLGFVNNDGLDRVNPRNIYATLTGSWKYVSSNGSVQTRTIELNKATIAARAIDDPVYYTGVTPMNGRLTYRYLVVPEMGIFDGDDSEDAINDKTITGRCVVNSLFGDLIYKKDSSQSEENVAGTSWSSTGGQAVITSYRHLYNIRRIHQNKTASFKIVCDLDWYIHDKVKVNGNIIDLYSSEVKVFSSEVKIFSKSYKMYSPVEGGMLKIVSFPALQKLYAKHQLSSMSSVSEKKIFSINNVQMRTASFRTGIGGDPGYGLICKNQGTVYNIYTDNLNLVLETVNDGSNSDYSLINSSESITISGGATKHLSQVPVGGLIGLNNSQIGLNEDSDLEAYNTIVMNNCVVMAGQYWKYADYVNGNSGVGGVVGYSANGTSIYGVIKTSGSFAVIGDQHVGGIIGQFNEDSNGKNAVLGARLVVDGNPSGNSEFSFPVNTITGQSMSCVVASSDMVGGAVGFLTRATLDHASSQRYTVSSPNGDGRITFGNLPDTAYQFNTILPQNSLIVRVGGADWPSIGGAIGNMKMDKGDYTSLNIHNDGWIVSYTPGSTSGNQTFYCGGAIGIAEENTLSDFYINIVNDEHSRISHLLDDGSTCVNSSGGAVGYLNHNSRARVTYAINADNSGLISAYGGNGGKGSSQGAGGAIGGTSIKQSSNNPSFLISVVNRESSVIEMPQDVSRDYGWDNGVGGAIGGMSNAQNYSVTAESVIFAENYGIIRGFHDVGGTIGRIVSSYGSVYAINHGMIAATEDNVGGVVGSGCSGGNNKQFGIIQAVLDGATITGQDFVGGAAGRLRNLQDNASIRTIVRSDSSINSTGSVVGGVCGHVRIAANNGCANSQIELKGDSRSPVLTVSSTGEGNFSIGGLIGLMTADVDNHIQVVAPDQSSINKLVIRVDGGSEVGGVIGKLRSSNNNDATDPSKVAYNDFRKRDMYLSISEVLLPQSYVSGTGSYVGGAVGFIDSNNGLFRGTIDVTSEVGFSDQNSSFIKGSTYVGGAVGRIDFTCPKDDDNGAAGGINVDFSASPWTIEGTGENGSGYTNVGGAVGGFDKYNGNMELYSTTGWDNHFPINAVLGSSTISGIGKNVGGAIGCNLIKNGDITVTSGGTISGKGNVGGAIGYNRADLNSITVNILGSGQVKGGEEGDEVSVDDAPLKSTTDFDGTNVGGAVGFNHSAVAVGITTNISGEVYGVGNNVGGSIGLCYASDNTPRWINSINVTLSGEGKVLSESNSVGGALGCTLGSIRDLKVNITGRSTIGGHWRVGGAIGFASCIHQKDNISSKNGAGVILNSRIVISADNALSGLQKVGGVVGQVSYNDEGTKGWTYAVFGDVTIEINAATLFDPQQTGPTEDPSEDVMAGGVVGLVSDGSLGNVILCGTGGTVHVDYPNRTYTNSVLISASGRSVGGIAGQIGMEARAPATFISTVTLGEKFPNFCVVSVNGADRIGGWFGSTHGQYGGLGKRETVTTYDVKNVKVVYSTGSSVGGLCGYMNLDHGNPTRTVYANIDVTLDEALIMGRTEVGGAIGSMGCGILQSGRISVTLKNHSNIGDLKGNSLPGDNTDYSCICYDAGGAIGRVYGRTDRAGELNIPVNVQIDSTSRIAGLAETADPSLPFTDAGVGGAFGRFDGKVDNKAYIHVDSDTSVVSVVSRYSNAGGCAGVLIGQFNNGGKDTFDENNPVNHHWSNVCVEANGDNICVGGFAGLVDSALGVNKSHSTGSVIATGQNSYVGGFAGLLRAGTISNSYSTSFVSSKGYCTGGFVGSAGNTGVINIKNCYVGGHTYEGQYIEGEGNISGTGNVGGFIGVLNGNVQIQRCYSTASVLGTGDNIGGFVGNYAVDNGFIEDSYTTSRVDGPMVEVSEDGIPEMHPADTVGAFAGYSKAVNGDRYKETNKAMSLINGGRLDLVGKAGNNIDVTPVASQIVFADQNNIHKGSPIAYPFDTSLLSDAQSVSTAFPLRAVLGNEHHGDWPNPATGDIDIRKATIELSPEEFVYDPNGVDVSTYLKLTFEDTELVLGQDYTLSYKNNDRAGSATVIIAAKAGSQYYGTVSKSFTINKANLSTATASISPTEYEYTGAPIVPTTVAVTLGGRELKQNQDYFLAYEREDESGLSVLDHTNTTKNGVIKVSVHGMGNYEGSKANIGSFIIKGSNLEAAEITLTNATAHELVYTGNEIVPGVIVRLGGKTLTENVDFEVSYENNIEAGNNSAKVTITGIGSYSGTPSVNYSISTATNSWETNASIEGWIYSESGKSANDPLGKTKFGDVVFEYYKDNGCTIPAVGEDSSVKPNDAGSYYLKAYTNQSEPNANGVVNYGSTVAQIVSFRINPKSISEASVVVDPSEYKYTGVNVKPENENIRVLMDDYQLEEGKDYTITYPSDTVGPGKITFTVNGIGNYTNTVFGTYQISKFFNVAFDSLEGTAVDTQEVKEGSYAVEPSKIPEKEGYVFDCWCTDTAGTLPFVFETTAIKNDITLYAKWSPAYTVSFNTHADGIEVDAQVIKSGEPAAEPEKPVWGGHVFEGWYSDEGFANLYDFTLPVTSEITLHAKWSQSDTADQNDPSSQPTDTPVPTPDPEGGENP